MRSPRPAWYLVLGIIVPGVAGMAALMWMQASDGERAERKRGPLVRAVAFTGKAPGGSPLFKSAGRSAQPAGPLLTSFAVPLRMQLSDLMLDIGDASGLEKMVNEWGSERDAAAWQHGAMEICALVRERPGNKSARFWRAWCTGLTRLPAQEFYERLSANSGTLIPLLASAEPIDNARPLRRLSGMLVDAWSSQGEPGTPGKQPGTPPALRELLQASLAGRDAAQGNFANLDAVPENLRHHAELEALTRLATHPKEMVDFVLTRATTFTLEDSEAAPMAGIGMTALPGYEDRIASVLAAPPSAARDLLLSYSVKARFHGTNVDLPALAAAITDDTLRASMQAAADGRFVWRSYREPR